jgi:hypothetical protein
MCSPASLGSRTALSKASGPGSTGGLAADVQRSLRRARLEAERRLLERERRGALARLGTRVSELVATGALAAAGLAGELARVEQASTRVEANGRETEALAPDRRVSESGAATRR